MKNLTIIIILSITLIPFLNPVFADYIIQTGNSSINWTKGHIISKEKSSIIIEGKGIPVDYYNGNVTSINNARMNAYLQAKENAILNIFNAIKFIRIDGDIIIQDLIKSNNFTQKRLSELILHSISEKENPDDFFTSSCELKLTVGDIISSIPADFPANDFPIRDDTPISAFYSGLIIDGRGFDIKPMLFPSIYNDDGLEIYGRIYIDSKYACKYGMVSYCYTEDEALRDRRAGEFPYFTVALKEIKGCPVISDRDTRKIFSDKKNINNLKKCRVIFILDKVK